MSKKKNTLKDLNEFLKQQAATLVSPTRLSDKIEQTTPKEQEAEEEKPLAKTEEQEIEKTTSGVSAEKILKDLRRLARQEGSQFNETLCDLIIKTLESQGDLSPENKMLINTALYLKSGDDWKDEIREYWNNHARR